MEFVKAEKPACKIIKQMKIDYNFIEVNDGYFFNIEKKCFEMDPPIVGSPRAFVFYNHKKRHNPTPSIEGEQGLRKDIKKKYE